MPKPTGKYVINGTRGDDEIDGHTYDQSLQDRGLSMNGGAGNDAIRGGSGLDYLNGGDGDDTLIAEMNDLIGLPAGMIVYQGGKGSDTLDLSEVNFAEGTGLWVRANGNPTWLATDYDTAGSITDPNWTWGTRWTNLFQGIENFILGEGNDNVQMISGSGNNTVWGGRGDDYIHTADGNDVLYGEDGNDVLSHGWGNDVMTGGPGNDAFLIQGRVVGQYTYDVVTDFDPKSDELDPSYDQLWVAAGWSIIWDYDSKDVLHGYYYDPAYNEIFGELTIQNLTLAHLPMVQVLSYDNMTGIAS